MVTNGLTETYIHAPLTYVLEDLPGGFSIAKLVEYDFALENTNNIQVLYSWKYWQMLSLVGWSRIDVMADF